MKFKICLNFWGVFGPWRRSVASYTTDERSKNDQKERWRLNLEGINLQIKSSSEKFRRLLYQNWCAQGQICNFAAFPNRINIAAFLNLKNNAFCIVFRNSEQRYLTYWYKKNNRAVRLHKQYLHPVIPSRRGDYALPTRLTTYSFKLKYTFLRVFRDFIGQSTFAPEKKVSGRLSTYVYSSVVSWK